MSALVALVAAELAAAWHATDWWGGPDAPDFTHLAQAALTPKD